jgi:hypothetical protein
VDQREREEGGDRRVVWRDSWESKFVMTTKEQGLAFGPTCALEIIGVSRARIGRGGEK